MEITFGVLIFCIVAFFVAGFIDSIAGGAGFVTAPSLLLIGMPPHMALGTGKLATSIGSVVALWTFWRSNLILKKIVPVGVLSAMAGASFGAFCALSGGGIYSISGFENKLYLFRALYCISRADSV